MSMTIKEMNAKAVVELTDVINRIDPAQIDILIEFLAKANRIFFYGVGREGLMMKALSMCLLHNDSGFRRGLSLMTPQQYLRV